MGTLGCVIVVLAFDLSVFPQLSDEVRKRAIAGDVILPIILAGPLIYFFSSKQRELAIAHFRLSINASTDSLTTLLNRGAFTSLVDAYLSQVAENERGISGALLVIDLDHFKSINDSFGHDQGDEALTLVARAIRATLRSGDLAGRIGGEEFVVFLPGATPASAQNAAERVRLAILSLDFEADGARRALSASVGGACFDRGIAFRALYRAADRQLYAAKESGRNRVMLSPVADAMAQAA